MIVSRDSIRRAVSVALHLDPKHSADDAIDSVAQAMAIPREAVQQAIDTVDDVPHGQTAASSEVFA